MNGVDYLIRLSENQQWLTFGHKRLKDLYRLPGLPLLGIKVPVVGDSS